MLGDMHAFNNIVSRYVYIPIEMIVAYFNNCGNNYTLKKHHVSKYEIWSKTSFKRLLKGKLFFRGFFY